MENNILNKVFEQKCGDFLKVLIKSTKKIGNEYLYKCQFQKYPYEIFARKQQIINGQVLNPQIEQVEFIDKIWPQKCGDSLKIIKKSDKKQGNLYLWECEFIKYPCKIFVRKEHILCGSVLNPKIEENDFIGHIFSQKCGDSLIVLKKTNEKDLQNHHYLYEYKFQKYFYKGLSKKYHIIEGNVDNPALPWKSKENLKKYIEENFKEKPTLQELCKKLEISYTTICHNINNFDLKEYIQYSLDGSYQEQELKNYFKSLNIQCSNSWNELNGKEIDIYIPNLKLGFEYNGNYWHSELFKSKDYHQEKSLQAQEKGIQLIHIWEWEWNQKESLIKSFIKSKLGIFEKKIYARKCEVKNLDNKTYQDFCNENHLQGYEVSKIKLGLYFEDKLVQIISFSKPRFTDKYEYEIIRECSKLGYCIIGGKEKLWSYFVKNFQPKSVISYCDFSKFTGNSYLKLGFKKERLNKPGFWWYDNKTNQIFWRNPYKHKEMKEKYIKIYDAGQLVFAWNNN